MFNLFRNSLKTTLNSVIVALPMIVFILLMQSYCNAINKVSLNLVRGTVAWVTLWLLISAFCAGWFYIIKRAIFFSGKVFVYDRDRNRALCEVFAGFFKGFAKTFLPFLCVVALGIFIRFIEIKIMNYVLLGTNGKFSYELWIFSIFILISCLSYWLVFWIPEIIYSQHNPFKALINSTKKAFITFPTTIKLFLIMWFLFIGMNILFQLLQLNPFLYFFAMLLNYYLILFTVILIFTYYEQNFLK